MLYYISNADIPSEKAHAIQQMKMCQAFERVGEKVCFVHPSHGSLSKSVSWNDVADFYGLTTEFDIQTIPSLQNRLCDFDRLELISMAGALASWTVGKVLSGAIQPTDTIYTRNYYATFLIVEALNLVPVGRRPEVYFERHDVLSAHAKSRFYSSVDGIVCITHALEEQTIETYGVDPQNCFVAPDGVDFSQYRDLDQGEAREKLGLTLEDDLVIYTGHLYPQKGGDVLASVADEINGEVYIVGGYPEDIERVESLVSTDNVTFTGFVPPADIPLYQIGADVLVAPYTWNARSYLSPLKLFEYMAAGRPIVASQLPVLEEVLEDTYNVLFVEPGDSEELADGINEVLGDKDLSERLAENAFADVEKYSWENRADRILSFVTI